LTMNNGRCLSSAKCYSLGNLRFFKIQLRETPPSRGFFFVFDYIGGRLNTRETFPMQKRILRNWTFILACLPIAVIAQDAVVEEVEIEPHKLTVKADEYFNLFYHGILSDDCDR